MVCHAYVDRIECTKDKATVTIGTDYPGDDRIEFLASLRENFRKHLAKKGVDHVTIDYPNLGMQAKKPNRQVGEVTGLIVGVALELGASVEKS